MPEDITEPTPDAPTQVTYPQIDAQITPDGLIVRVVPAPIMVTIGNEELKAICRGLLNRDPAFATEVVQQVIEQARSLQEKIAVVRDPKTVKRISRSKEAKA